MKGKSFIFIFLILFLTISAVSAEDNVTVAEDLSMVEDDLSLNHADEDVLEAGYKLSTNDLVKYYRNETQFKFKLTDSKNNPLPGQSVVLKVHNREYEKTTNKLGVGKLTINLAPGDYVITTTYKGLSQNNTIKVLPRLSGSDVSTTYTSKAKFSVKLVDNQGNPMDNEPVNFTVGSRSYSAYTNSKGVASINPNLDAGNYVIKYSSCNLSAQNKFVVKNYYKLSVYKWSSGADVTKNKKIKKNIPNSKLVKKVVQGTKSGIPIIKFKGGKGKTVFITAGVHGNELSSQIAAMKMIQYLETHPVKGTVYIIPFMNPKATAKNVRDYGVKLNSNANKKGTISYKTVNLIVKFKCDAYGDFHCTRPGGKPGCDVAMGSYLPTAGSATLAKYIAKKSKVNSLIYDLAGDEYPGALEDEVNLKNIPAVTCEVITPHGTIASGSVSKSLSMMKSLLKYNSLL